MEGIDPTNVSQEDEILIISIRRESLNTFWSIEMGKVRSKLKMLRKMGMMSRKDLGLEYWFPLLGPYLLKYEVGMGVACVTLRMLI